MSEIMVYQADVYCVECGMRIQRELTAAGKAPAEPSNEHTHDSDDFPKGPFADEESDAPEHCANCHKFLKNPLTSDGYKYVKQSLDDTKNPLSPELKELADFYGFHHFEQPFESASDWLRARVRQYSTGDRGELLSLVTGMLDLLSEDEIQDAFQSEMDEDGYFKKSGGHSDEEY